MKYQRLSTRQNLAMTWWNRPGFEVYDGIICDGSIRSGKTVAMTVGFIMWAMTRFDGCNFAICGNTDKISNPNLIYPGQVLTIP